MHTELIKITLRHKIPRRQILRFQNSGINTDFCCHSIVENYMTLHFGPSVADKGDVSQMFSKD